MGRRQSSRFGATWHYHNLAVALGLRDSQEERVAGCPAVDTRHHSPLYRSHHFSQSLVGSNHRCAKLDVRPGKTTD